MTSLCEHNNTLKGSPKMKRRKCLEPNQSSPIQVLQTERLIQLRNKKGKTLWDLF